MKIGKSHFCATSAPAAAIVLASLLLSSPFQSTHGFTVVSHNLVRSRTNTNTNTPLYIASIPRTKKSPNSNDFNNSKNNNINFDNTRTRTAATTTTTTTTTNHEQPKIDHELSAQNPDPKYHNHHSFPKIMAEDLFYYHDRNDLSQSLSSSAQSPSLSSSSSIMHEMHSILDDGHGHINSDLATSIWTWENENLQPDIHNDPFPLASKLQYSTRDGLRIIESVANDIISRMMEESSSSSSSFSTGYKEERYNDLVQEGVVALMKAMIVFGSGGETGQDTRKEGTVLDPNQEFEAFATMEIQKAMQHYMKQTNNGISILLDLLRKRVDELEQKAATATTTSSTKNAVQINKKKRKQRIIILEAEPCDQIVQPLREAVLDENPTPDEIALSDMIRNDIGDFLERTLNEEELIVIRMRFGLEVVDTSLKAISVNLGKSVNDVQELEYEALKKLRTSFSNDYIGAYLDDDNTEEVSL